MNVFRIVVFILGYLVFIYGFLSSSVLTLSVLMLCIVYGYGTLKRVVWYFEEGGMVP